MRAAPARRAHRDDGAVLVEAALVLPLLLLFILGLVDFSAWEFQRSQASSGARDGARTGIVLPLDATSTTAVTDAVKARIPDADRLTSLQVRMYCSGGDPAVAFSGCSPAIPGTTRFVVEASWRFQPVSFLGIDFGQQTISGRSEMLYVGPPRSAGGGGADVCDVTWGSATVPTITGGTLSADLVQGFTTNGNASCTGFSTVLVDDGGTSRGTGTVTVSGTTGTIRFPSGSVTGLAPGTYTIRLTTSDRQWTRQVTLASSPVCTVTAVASPTTVTLSGQSGSLNQDITGTVTIANCAGQFTAELVRLQDSAVLQTSTPASGSFVVTFSKNKNDNAGKVSFTSGGYVVRISGGSLPAPVVSNTVTVP